MALDILDNIQREHQVYLTMKPDFERLQINRSQFLLDNITWEKYTAELADKNFSWNEVKYSDLADEVIQFADVFPDATGVYLLIVRPNIVINNAPKFVYYVGIAGSTDTGNPLRDRIRNYFQLSHLKKRNQVEILINKYYSNLLCGLSKSKFNIINWLII